MATKEEILSQCYKNESSYWEYPMYGGVPNWFLLYWELHNKVLNYFDEEPYTEPVESYYDFLNKKTNE